MTAVALSSDVPPTRGRPRYNDDLNFYVITFGSLRASGLRKKQFTDRVRYVDHAHPDWHENPRVLGKDSLRSRMRIVENRLKEHANDTPPDCDWIKPEFDYDAEVRATLERLVSEWAGA